MALKDMTKTEAFIEAYDQHFAELGHDPRAKSARAALADMLPAAVRQLRSLLTMAGIAWGVAFSPDGKLLAAGGADNVARVWSVDEKKRTGELKGHTAWVLGTSFSADGKFLVTSSADRTAQVWEVGTWKMVAKLDQMEPVSGAMFGPNAELVALAVSGPTNRMIHFRRRDNTQVARQIDMGAPGPLGLVWAPAGNRMYVPLTDKTVRVYDPNSGGHVATLTGHADWVYAAAVTLDGSKLATASADGTVKLDALHERAEESRGIIGDTVSDLVVRVFTLAVGDVADPILDAAKPQIAAIHQEAMQKTRSVIDGALSQIRPLLTAQQQTKLDAIQKAHQDMMNAAKELHQATQQ